MLLIQVPLIQPRPSFPSFEMECCAAPMMSAGSAKCRSSADLSNVEEAVISHGEIEGDFTEIDGLAIKRDPQYPIRVTVQFYKATSNGVVSAQDLRDVADQIDAVYEDARCIGSLVTDGDQGRSTDWHA